MARRELRRKGPPLSVAVDVVERPTAKSLRLMLCTLRASSKAASMCKMFVTFLVAFLGVAEWENVAAPELFSKQARSSR